MFQFQTMSTTKRRRDDDSDSEEERNFKVRVHSIPRNSSRILQVQKSRAICFTQLNRGYAQSPLHINARPSLPPSPPGTTAMTPTHSENGATTLEDGWGGPVQSSHWADTDYSMDMDEDENQSDVRSQPPESPFGRHLFRPPTLNPSSSLLSDASSNGRIPTPIHPTFNRRRYPRHTNSTHAIATLAT